MATVRTIARIQIRLRNVIAPLACVMLVVLFAACTSAPSSDNHKSSSSITPPFPPSTSGLQVHPASSFTSVFRSAAFAYRWHRDPRSGIDVLATGGETFESRIVGGALEVTPRRAQTGAGESATTPPAPTTPLSLETARIVRGETTLTTTAGTTTALEADGSVTVHHGGPFASDISEHLESDGAGVEQSWRFAHAPAGRGDLVVHVRASGEHYQASSDHGLHFAGGALGGATTTTTTTTTSTPGLRYGTATWIDADGKRTTIVPVFVGNEIVLTIPESVVQSSRFPSILDPTITPEFEIDKPITGGAASGDQITPVIVRAGQNGGYFAIWYDRRGLRPALYGARLGANGTVLDNAGILITSTIGGSVVTLSPAPDGYLVAWTVPSVNIYQAAGVYALRLGVDGKPADATPIVIQSGKQNSQAASASFDGANWLVAWQSYGGATGYDIQAARITRAGVLLDATAIEITKDPLSEYTPVVLFDGTDYLVAWRGSTTIVGKKVSTAGTVISAAPITLATASINTMYEFSAAFDGNEYAFIWREYRSSPTYYDVYARRVDKAGNPLDVAPIAIANDANYDYTPKVVWDGTNFLVVWRRLTSLTGRRLPTVGAPIEATPITIATGTFSDYSIASDGTASVALTREASGSTVTAADIKGVVISKVPPTNAPLFVVSQAANSETQPSVSYDGVNHHVVWIDTRETQPTIWGAVVAPNGTPQAPTRLVSNAKYTTIVTVRIAGDSKGSFLVFTGHDSAFSYDVVRGLRLDNTGQPIGSEVDIRLPPTTGYEYPTEPSVALDGNNYFVVWARQSDEGYGIVGARVPARSGPTLDQEPIRISTTSPNDRTLSPSVDFDGNNYFVAWQTSRYAPAGIDVSHIFGTRVSKEAAILDGEVVVCNAFLLQRAPFVAGDPKNHGFFVVWEDYRKALDSADVYGTRISAEGQNVDGVSGMKIVGGDHDESRPRATASSDGANWVVAWRDLRSKESYDIYGAWVSLAGKNHDPEGKALSADSGDEEAPWLSASTDGQLLLAYQRLDPRQGYGSYRLKARSIVSGALTGAACADNEACASRSCTDGICCATECGGCGVCNVQPGVCTPRAAGTESQTCASYKCTGTLACPSTCTTDADCRSQATCDPNTKTCVSRVICIDDHSLKDLTGKVTDCAPFKCQADACRTQCGSVDDCAAGFVCNYSGRCVQPPSSSDEGCAIATTTGNASSSSNSGVIGVCGAFVALSLLRRRRSRSPGSVT